MPLWLQAGSSFSFGVRQAWLLHGFKLTAARLSLCRIADTAPFRGSSVYIAPFSVDSGSPLLVVVGVRAVLERFGDVLRGDGGRIVEVGDGACNFDAAHVGSGAQPELVRSLIQNSLGG